MNGLRINWSDAGLEQINGINITLWKPEKPMSGTVNGLAIGLAGLLEQFEAAKLGIEYLYPFPSGTRRGSMLLVFRLDDPLEAAERLRRQGVRVLDRAEVLARLAG